LERNSFFNLIEKYGPSFVEINRKGKIFAHLSTILLKKEDPPDCEKHERVYQACNIPSFFLSPAQLEHHCCGK
jgi:hypothetical protein